MELVPEAFTCLLLLIKVVQNTEHPPREIHIADGKKSV